MTGKHDAVSAEVGRAGSGPVLVTRIGLRLAAGWRRLMGSASSAAIAFCLLACACSMVAVAGPRTGAQLGTRAFQQLVATSPAIDKAVYGTVSAADLAGLPGQSVGAGQIQWVGRQLRNNLATIAPLAGPRSDWAGMTTPFAGFADHSPAVAFGAGTQFELAYRSDLGGNARLVAGSLPAGHPASPGQMITQAAITAATARRYDLHVGSRVQLGGTGITLLVTGIVKPDVASGPFWQADPVVAKPVLVTPQGRPPYWQGGAFVPASALPVLVSQFTPSNLQLSWMFGLRLNQLTGSQAIALSTHLQPISLNAAGQVGVPDIQGIVQVNLTTGASLILASFSESDAAIGNVLDLMSVSLAVVGAGVVLLAAWLVAERRREEFAALRARGASRRQLGVAALWASAICALPGIATGIAIALLLTPGQRADLAWWLAGLTVATALAGPALITVRMHRGYAALTRPDQPPSRMMSVRRLVAEAALSLIAVGGLITLRHQSTGPGNSDLYASTAPILVAIPVAIVLLRLYPLLVRPLLQIASRRSGVTVFLGLARAARVSATSVLPAFAMVLALSLVSFAGMVREAVVRGEVAESWQQTGADAVIAVPNALSAAQQRAVVAVPGVQRTAAIGLISGTQGFSGSGITAVVADPAQYAALLAATPLTRAPTSFTHWTSAATNSAATNSAATSSAATSSAATSNAATGRSGAVPVLASPVLAARLGRAPFELVLQTYQSIRIYVAGTAPAMSAVGPVSSGPAAGYVVLPRSALRDGAPPATALLAVGASLDGGALQKVVSRWHTPGAGVTLRSALLARLEQAPVQHAAYFELALGGVAAVAGCLLVLFLTLMLSAKSRQLTLTRAATMGMSTAQARWLALVEALPQIVSVLAGGVICALALAPLVGPALELSVFTGSTAAVPVRVEPVWLTTTAIGLLVLAIATLTGQTVLASRGTARSLRMDG